MEVRLETILDYLDITSVEYEYIGSKNITINCFSSISNISSNCMSWLEQKENISECDFSDIKNTLIIVPDSMQIVNVSNRLNFIVCKEPKLTFFSIVNEFFKSEDYSLGVNKNSIINTSSINENINVGAYCYIGKEVVFEEGVILKNNISIEGKVFIGQGTVINSGTVIGRNSYDFLTDKEGKKIQIPRYGGVYIGRNVEIGANTVIERGTVDDTKIMNSAKIGNGCVITSDTLINEEALIEDGKII